MIGKHVGGCNHVGISLSPLSSPKHSRRFLGRSSSCRRARPARRRTTPPARSSSSCRTSSTSSPGTWRRCCRPWDSRPLRPTASPSSRCSLRTPRRGVMHSPARCASDVPFRDTQLICLPSRQGLIVWALLWSSVIRGCGFLRNPLEFGYSTIKREKRQNNPDVYIFLFEMRQIVS